VSPVKYFGGDSAGAEFTGNMRIAH
jgi:hypothetical protein